MRRVILLSLVALLTGCSFVNDFDVCRVSTECPPDHLCTADKLCRPILANGCREILGRDVQRSNALRVGLVTHLTGAGTLSGSTTRKAVENAVGEIQTIAGAHGSAPLSVIVCDDETDPARVPAIMSHLASLGVPAVIGSNYSSVSLEVARAAKANRMLAISPSSTSIDLDGGEEAFDDGFFWRTAPSDRIQGKTLGRFMKERLEKYLGEQGRTEPAKLAIVYIDDLYGRSLKNETMPALGPALLNTGMDGLQIKEISYSSANAPTGDCAADDLDCRCPPPPETDGRLDALSLDCAAVYVQRFMPTVTLVISLDEIGGFFTTLKGIDPQTMKDIDFFVSDGGRSESLFTAFTAKSLVPDFLFGTGYAARNDAVYAEYKGRFQQDAEDSWSEHAYDAVHLVAFALAADAVPTGETMVAALKRLDNANYPEKLKVTQDLSSIMNAATDPDRKLTLLGASGRLVFNPDNGERKNPDIHRWIVRFPEEGTRAEFGECGQLPLTAQISMPDDQGAWCAAACACRRVRDANGDDIPDCTVTGEGLGQTGRPGLTVEFARACQRLIEDDERPDPALCPAERTGCLGPMGGFIDDAIDDPAFWASGSAEWCETYLATFCDGTTGTGNEGAAMEMSMEPPAE